MDRLREVLSGAGKSTEVYEAPDGSRVLLLPYGARVLGLYPAGGGENFLWTNSALEDVESAKALYGGDEWQNSGGDRTWLGPEVDIFFPDYPACQRHWEPPQLDASDYKVISTDTGLGLGKRVKLDMARAGCSVEVNLRKFVSSAPNPLRYERDLPELPSVQYAGYTLTAHLEFVDSDAPVQVGLWNLLQMRHGGDLLISTYSPTRPLILFGDIVEENLVTGDHLVRFRIVAPGEHKIAVRAVATTGRIGYFYPASGGAWNLVVRNFQVNPSGEYVDVPKNDLADLGYSFNAVSIDSALGDFCELEYHVPAIGYGTGRTACEDSVQTWAFRGSREDILVIARRLLGPEV